MDKFPMKAALAAAALSLGVVQPAQAAVGCRSPEAASAVKVKDLQSRLMVATLRCNAMGFDNSAPYNSFVLANTAALNASNRAVKARFEAAHGSRWQNAYDRWNTSLANAYGADPTDRAICKATASIAREAAAARGNSDALLAIAERMGSAPAMPGGRCGASSLASR